jgi:hypothetical protein
LAVAVVLSGLSLASAPAQAATSAEWSVAPYYNGRTAGPRDWFDFSLKPGQTFRDIVSISNLSGQPKTFYVYPTDAYNTPLDGSFALLLRKDTPKDAGRWIRLGYTKLSVGKNQRIALPFEIDVPANAEPGDHAAGIVVEDVNPPKAANNGKGVVVQQRVATRVYIRVAGPLQPALEVTKIAMRTHKSQLAPWGQGASAQVGFIVKNTGNVRLTSTAQLTMKGLLGRTLKTFKVHQLPELLPGGTVAITEQWNGLPWLNRVSAQVHVVSLDKSVDITRSKTFWLGPWWIIPVIVGILLLFLGWRWWRRRRRNRAENNPIQPSAPNPEPVSTVTS